MVGRLCLAMKGCRIVVTTGIVHGSARQGSADCSEQSDSWLNQEFSMELFPILKDCEDEDVKSKEASETMVEGDSSKIEFKAEDEDELVELVDKKEIFPSTWGI